MSLAFQKMLRVIWLQIKNFVLSKKNEIKLKKNKLIFACFSVNLNQEVGEGSLYLCCL